MSTNPYKVGDTVIIADSGLPDLTQGRGYEVTATAYADRVRVIDDDGDPHDVDIRHLVAVAKPVSSAHAPSPRFTVGEKVTVLKHIMLKDVTFGQVYEVQDVGALVDTVHIEDDSGTIQIIPATYFVLAVTKQPATKLNPVPNGKATRNPFKQGDWVEFTGGGQPDLTTGNDYEVIHLMGAGYIRVTDDAGDDHDCPVYNFQPSVAKLARSTTAAPTFKQPFGGGVSPDLLICDDDVEDEPAVERVTSKGHWNKGEVLAYSDGTTTLTTLTVARCTATSVWFEETYSTPFNPEEFFNVASEE